MSKAKKTNGAMRAKLVWREATDDPSLKGDPKAFAFEKQDLFLILPSGLELFLGCVMRDKAKPTRSEHTWAAHVAFGEKQTVSNLSLETAKLIVTGITSDIIEEIRGCEIDHGEVGG